MAWEKRHKKQLYFYKSVRVGRRVKKVYCGSGASGRAAEKAEAARRARRDAEARAWGEFKARLEALQTLGNRFREGCELLRDAVLLLAGFHRPNRQPWRKWDAAWRDSHYLAPADRRH